MVPYGDRGNGLELIAEIFSIDDSAIDGDDNVVLLDEYRIVVAFPVQDFVAGRVLPRVVADGIVGIRGIPLVKFGTKFIRFRSGFYAEGDIAFFFTGVDIYRILGARQAVLGYPETDAENVAERLPAFAIGDAHAGFCYSGRFLDLRWPDDGFAGRYRERVCTDIDVRDDGQVLGIVLVVLDLVKRERVALVAKKDRVLESRVERDGDDHGIECRLVVQQFGLLHDVFRYDDWNLDGRDFERFAGDEVPLDVLRRGFAVGLADKRDVRKFHRRDFVDRYGSGLGALVVNGDAVERARDAERVALVERVGAELELEACVLFEACRGLELLRVRLVVFDGNRLVAGLGMFRVADLQGVVACGNAVDGVLAGLVRRGGLDGRHAGGDVVCRDEAYLGACDRLALLVCHGAFDACDGRAGFSFREDACVVFFGTGGEKRCCESECARDVEKLEVHHALASGSRFENRCRFI